MDLDLLRETVDQQGLCTSIFGVRVKKLLRDLKNSFSFEIRRWRAFDVEGFAKQSIAGTFSAQHLPGQNSLAGPYSRAGSTSFVCSKNIRIWQPPEIPAVVDCAGTAKLLPSQAKENRAANLYGAAGVMPAEGARDFGGIGYWGY